MFQVDLILSSMFPPSKACRARHLQEYMGVRLRSLPIGVHRKQQNECAFGGSSTPQNVSTRADLTPSDRIQPGRGCMSQPPQRLLKVAVIAGPNESLMDRQQFGLMLSR